MMIYKDRLRKSRCISALLCLFLFSACNHHAEQAKDEQLILQAGKAMTQQPDSALVWLRSIENPQDLSKPQQANYYLLLAKALFETKSGLYQDSLTTKLGACIDFFQQRKEYQKLAWAYYLRNRAHYDSDKWAGDSDKAMQLHVQKREVSVLF